MQNKKNHLFTGFEKVFRFTTKQNGKGKAVKLTTFLIGAVIALICFAIPVIMAVSQKPDEEEKEDKYQIEENSGDELCMDGIMISGSESLETAMEEFLVLCDKKDIEVTMSQETETEEFADECTNNYDIPLGLMQKEEEDKLLLQVFYTEEGGLEKEVVESFMTGFCAYYEDVLLQQSGLEEDMVLLLNMSTWTDVEQAGEEAEEEGVFLAKIIVPMIFSLLLYTIAILQGQVLMKVLILEKSSKLMEVLLTSIQPYALIAGKIASVYVVSILQMILWFVLGMAGYLSGCAVGEAIYPEYQNYISLIVDLIQESGTGFHLEALLLAAAVTLIGFFLYCVWAGFIASAVDKVDDLSTVTTLYQIPIILGFMISYMGSAMQTKGLIDICKYLPVTSPFVMPAELLTGNASIVSGVISLLLLVALTLVLLLLTGKVYKNKLFKR